MNLEEKLNELQNYDVTFEIKQGYYHISLKYNDDWNIVKPNNELIYVEERKGLHHYIASIGSVSIDDIFDAVNETIEFNKDLERKLELFVKKTKELQELFSNESYEYLESLEFKFTKKKGKKKAAQKKEEETVEETVEENIANNNDTVEEDTGFYDDNPDGVVEYGTDYMQELEK